MGGEGMREMDSDEVGHITTREAIVDKMRHRLTADVCSRPSTIPSSAEASAQVFVFAKN